ncbi:MAG: hypothetical protein ACRECV_14345 [Xanthobacteraceae bacterium]
MLRNRFEAHQTKAHQRNGRRSGLTAPWLRAARRAALAGVVICAGTAMARAGDDTMSTGTSFYDEILQVVGLGGGGNIQYSERSPLVVPPTRDLPPPMADRPPAVADWPKDPDMQRRERAKIKERPKPHLDYAISEAMPLRPDQLNVPGANASATNSGGPRPALDPADYPEKQGQSKFSFFGLNPFASKTEYATFTGEPDRTSLTDPPPGYLTPSPDQPYGVSPEQKRYKIPTVADRVTPVSGSSGGQ